MRRESTGHVYTSLRMAAMNHYLLNASHNRVDHPLVKGCPSISWQALWNRRIKEIFHGQIIHPPLKDLFDRGSRPLVDAKKLVIERSGVYIPEFFGIRNHCVSQQCAEALASLPGVRFQEVDFSRLIDIDLLDTEYDWPTELREFASIFELPPCWDMERTDMEPYFELLLPSVNDFQPGFDVLARTKRELALTTPWCIPEQLIGPVLTPEFLAQYPMISSSWGIITNGEVLQTLGPYIDWRFYQAIKPEPMPPP